MIRTVMLETNEQVFVNCYDEQDYARNQSSRPLSRALMKIDKYFLPPSLYFYFGAPFAPLSPRLCSVSFNSGELCPSIAGPHARAHTTIPPTDPFPEDTQIATIIQNRDGKIRRYHARWVPNECWCL